MKNQKNSGLFWFFAWIVFTCLLKICPKNKKRPEFFWFFGLLQVRVPPKIQKKTWVFLVFSRSWPKKNKKTRGKQKRNKHEPQTKHSLKSFGFLVFSRFSQQGAQNLRSRNVRSVIDIGVAIMFFLFCRHISKKTHSITGLWYPLFPYANAFPQNMSGNLFWTSFFEDRTFSKGSSLVSLTTGLFQREVACKEESSIWTNRLSVKQAFL